MIIDTPILVAIESPLMGDYARHHRYALWAAYDCHHRGEAAFAGHLLFPQFLDDQDARHRAFGIAAHCAWADLAALRAFYLDLGMSSGMQEAKDSMPPAQPWERRYLPTYMMGEFSAGRFPPSSPHWVRP